MRKTTINVFILTAALALTFLGLRAVAASQPGQQSKNEPAAKKETVPDSTIYRVRYRVNEVENGKTINSRSYTLMAQPGKTMSLRIGSRVPYSVYELGKGVAHSFNYSNVGMDIDSTIDEQDGYLLVHTKLDMSTLATKEPQSSPDHPPVFNQLRLVDTTSATLGKPAFVGATDDVASNRHYVIEVTVTKAM
jgi:hypothetical protein